MSIHRNHSIRQHSPTNGLIAPFVIFGLVALALLGVGAYFYMSRGNDSDMIDPIMAEVTRGEFVAQVLDQGEVQSSENVEIRCEVGARNGSISVLSVVQEGTLVKEGDFLVQLDSSSFEKELEQQKVVLANARASEVQAESALATARATREEYIEGTYKQGILEIQKEINTGLSNKLEAEMKVSQATDVLVNSEKLQAKGYITSQQLETDRIALESAKLDVKAGEIAEELGNEKLRVLRDISSKKELIQLQADIDAAEVKLKSETESLGVETATLEEVQALIEKCTIKVPKRDPPIEGQVVFAKESSRGGNDWILEEGTSVRENQVLIRLPNPNKMEVKALINEQSITRIEPNMPATIRVDALNNVTLKGIVTKVNQYAESGGFMSSSIRKYAVNVRILDPPPALKPGMNASVTIQVQYEPDVLLAPIQTVYSVQEQQFCLIRQGQEWKTVEVEIAGDNSQLVYIKSGIGEGAELIKEGAELVMNPGAYKEYMDLPEFKLDTKIDLPEGTETVVAKTSEGSAAKPGPGQGGGGGGGFSPNAMIDGMMSRYDSNGDGAIDAGPSTTAGPQQFQMRNAQQDELPRHRHDHMGEPGEAGSSTHAGPQQRSISVIQRTPRSRRWRRGRGLGV